MCNLKNTAKLFILSAFSSEMTLKENVHKLNNMIMEGNLMKAFEKFYEEEIIMQENSEEPRVGKDANRKFEEQFISNIQEVHDAKAETIAYNEETGITMVQWSFDMTFKDGTRKKMSEVSVQLWENGKIIHERFF